MKRNVIKYIFCKYNWPDSSFWSNMVIRYPHLFMLKYNKVDIDWTLFILNKQCSHLKLTEIQFNILAGACYGSTSPCKATAELHDGP